MGTNIDVGGRLHSAATGNILTGANEIYDDNLNKKQDVINREILEDITDVKQTTDNIDTIMAEKIQQQLNLTLDVENDPNDIIGTNSTVPSSSAVRGSIDARTGYFECTSTGETVAKVVNNATGFVLTPGGNIRIKFSYKNTATNPTLSINGTTAKSMIYNGEAVSPTNTWNNNEVVTLYYDGTNYILENNSNNYNSSNNGTIIVTPDNIPTTFEQDKLYFVDNRNGNTEITIDTNVSVPAGATTHVYHDGNGWVVTEDSSNPTRKGFDVITYEDTFESLSLSLGDLHDGYISKTDGVFKSSTTYKHRLVELPQSLYDKKILVKNNNTTNNAFVFFVDGNFTAGFVPTFIGVEPNFPTSGISSKQEFTIPTPQNEESVYLYVYGEDVEIYKEKILNLSEDKVYLIDNQKGLNKITISDVDVDPGLIAHAYYKDDNWVVIVNTGTQIIDPVSTSTIPSSKAVADYVDNGIKTETTLVADTDYTVFSKQSIGNGCTITEYDSDQYKSYYISSEIHLLRGEELRVTNGSSIGGPAPTGACIYKKLPDGKYYAVNGLRKYGTASYSWIADTDCYVRCQFYGSGVIKKITYNDNKKKQLLDKVDKQNDLFQQKVAMYYDRDWTKLLADRNSDILKAMIDREAMINEARMLEKEDVITQGVTTNPRVLCEGPCGFTRDSNGDPQDNGTIKFRIYDTGLLHIKGHGEMYDYVKGTNYDHDYNTIIKSTSLPASYWNNGNPVSATRYQMATYYGFFINDNGYFTYQDKSVNEGNDMFGKHYQEPTIDAGETITYADRPKHYVPDSIGDSALYKNYNTGDSMTGHYKGYCAPWCRYRSEFQFGEGYLGDITTDLYEDSFDRESYYNSNPLGIRYDRILIEDDNAEGITYLGSWAFYRCTAKSIVLPNHVERIGSWCFRYSPTLETIVFPDSVHIYEDMSISRNEVLRTVRFGNYNGEGTYEMHGGALSQCYNITEIKFPIGKTMTCNLHGTLATPSLRYIEYNNMSVIPTTGGLTNPAHLEFVRISSNTTIPQNAYNDIIVDCAVIVSGTGLTITQTSKLYENTNVVAINSSVTTNAYNDEFQTNYRYVCDKNGYHIYVHI